MRELSKAARYLEGGGLALYPTDTLYALGAYALDEGAVKALYELKRRPLDRPVSVAVPPGRVGDVAETDGFDEVLGLLPGPITLLLPALGELPAPLVKEGKVGVRVPDDPGALSLLEQLSPLTCTSANVSGKGTAPRPQDSDLSSEVDIVIDDGPRAGPPSTVYDCVEGEVIRAGGMDVGGLL